MSFKRRFCVLFSLLIVVGSCCTVAYATTQEKITRQAMGTTYTDSLTCTALVITDITTYSKYAYGYLQCYVDGGWKDVPDYVATVDNNRFDLTLDELNSLFITSKSSFTCQGKLAITVPLTTYKNYLVVTAH